MLVVGTPDRAMPELLNKKIKKEQMRNAPTRTATLVALAAALLLSPFSASSAKKPPAEKPKPAIELGAPFADNAILQREMPVPVWGWSKPGTKVTVEFAGQKKTATAGKDGKWMLELDPLKASAEPARDDHHREHRQDASPSRTSSSARSGWPPASRTCSGSSSKCDVGQVLLKQIDERVEAGEEKPPVIREAKVTNYFACLHPIEHADGEWSTATAATPAPSPIAFAYKLHQELGVPIGILNCSFSQTAIQAWTPRVRLRRRRGRLHQGDLPEDPRDRSRPPPSTRRHGTQFYQEIEDTIKENDERVKKGEEAKAIPTKTPGNLQRQPRRLLAVQRPAQPDDPLRHPRRHLEPGLRQHGRRPALLPQPAQHDPRLAQVVEPARPAGLLPPVLLPRAEGRVGQQPEHRQHRRDAPRHLAGPRHPQRRHGQPDRHHRRDPLRATRPLPGQRLALHALKNQYGKDIVADGPMFKSYTVKGDKLIVTFDHADGGLVVAETGTKPGKERTGFADPDRHPERRRPGEALLPGRRRPRLASGQHEDRRQQGHRDLARR